MLPVLGFGALEVGLRLGGYGYPTSFFIKQRVNGRDVFVENNRFAFRFFPRALARSPAPTILEVKKAAGTYRIFIIGESAALGDPEPAFGFGRYLEVMLRERFPKVQFEVIPAAVTAINSHALLPIARECARHDGDIWIIYMGNNEVVGPFGAGAGWGKRAPPLWAIRSTLALKNTRTGQLLGQLAERFGGNASSARSWQGMKMFLEAQTRQTDESRKRTKKYFRENLEEILASAKKAGVQVILSTVSVNLKDCAPFASLHSSQLSESQRVSWEQLYKEGSNFQLAGKWEQAIAQYTNAVAVDSEFAELEFRLGRCYLTISNSAMARRCFEFARDADALSFRADTAIDQSIREAGTRSTASHKNISLFDAEEVLGELAEEKIPGNDLFYEHVHLNFEGNYLLAKALAEEVAGRLPASLSVGEKRAWPSTEICERKLGVTAWDRYRVYENILQRESEPPFTLQMNHEEQIKQLADKLKEIRTQMTPENAKGAREWYQQALAERPEDFLLRGNFAKLLEDTGDYTNAAVQWGRVADLLPYHFGPSYYLGKVLARMGRYSEAEAAFNKTLQLWPNVPEALDELGQIRVKEKKPADALPYFQRALELQPANARFYLHRAQALAAQERRDEAIGSLEKAVQLRPTFWEARYYLGVELAMRGQVEQSAEQFKEVKRLEPDYALAHLNLGVAFAKEKRLPEAIAEFRETLRLDPGNKQAQEYLGKLEKVTNDQGPASQ